MKKARTKVIKKRNPIAKQAVRMRTKVIPNKKKRNKFPPGSVPGDITATSNPSYNDLGPSGGDSGPF